MCDRLIPSVPVFDLADLDGKVLTISVGQGYNVERGIRFTSVIGTDENGISYVLVDQREPINVRPD
jgi:hypothetical protein